MFVHVKFDEILEVIEMCLVVEKCSTKFVCVSGVLIVPAAFTVINR